MDSKVVIVTGAAGAIGMGICKSLAAKGMTVVAADLDEERCKILCDDILNAGGQALSLRVNTTSKSSLESMVSSVLGQFGRIDVLVNNAGIIELGPLASLSEEAWDRVIEVNLKGTFLSAQAVVPAMIEQKEGAVINISSVAGKRPAPLQSAYAAAKHGIIGLTQVWCQELAEHNITVNTVCPGFVASPMWEKKLGPAYAEKMGTNSSEVLQGLAKALIPLGRPQEPEDIGAAVAYLASAKNVTGSVLMVDGGLVM